MPQIQGSLILKMMPNFDNKLLMMLFLVDVFDYPPETMDIENKNMAA